MEIIDLIKMNFKMLNKYFDVELELYACFVHKYLVCFYHSCHKKMHLVHVDAKAEVTQKKTYGNKYISASWDWISIFVAIVTTCSGRIQDSEFQLTLQG